MALKQDLLSINRMHFGEPNVILPYTYEDVRHLLIFGTKFNKTFTLNGTLHAEVIDKLRSEGIDVSLAENNHTVLSWQIR